MVWTKFSPLLFVVLFSKPILASNKFMIMSTLAMVPTSFENVESMDEKLKKDIDTSFFTSVKQSNRFRIISEGLTEKVWDSVTTRQELIDEFEINAFANLTVTQKNDAYMLVARLLSPQFETLLQEIETILIDDAFKMSYIEVQKKVSSLTFRLLNRLPVDIFVTSVHGRYITLTGGRLQSLFPDQEITIVRPTIEARHPANQTILSFKTEVLATAQIHEVEEWTSVAKILSQTYENAVEVGDGSKISSIYSRNYFAAQTPFQPKNMDEDKPIIIEPLYPKHLPKFAGTPVLQKQPPRQQKTPLKIKPNIVSTSEQKAESKVDQKTQPIKWPKPLLGLGVVNSHGESFVFVGAKVEKEWHMPYHFSYKNFELETLLMAGSEFLLAGQQNFSYLLGFFAGPVAEMKTTYVKDTIFLASLTPLFSMEQAHGKLKSGIHIATNLGAKYRWSEKLNITFEFSRESSVFNKVFFAAQYEF